ncbi:MAG: hypothetical protein ACOYJC_06395 [Christensenellales bacterium]
MSQKLLAGLFVMKDYPAYICSDNGSAFMATRLRDRPRRVGGNTAYIESGSPWENGYCERFNT